MIRLLSGRASAHAATHLRWRWFRRILMASGLAVLVTGCAAPARPVVSEPDLLQQRAANEQAQHRVFVGAIERLVDRLAPLAARQKEPLTVNILAMSGGGDYGAFGAGFLVGWGQTPEAAARRPEFDVVTGVSTGALLAPFAFVGTDASCQLIEKFYRHPQEDWIKPRSPLYFLPANPSFMILPGLQREIKAGLGQTMIEAVAAEAAKGKILVISATNLDYGTQQFWDFGQEALQAARHGADADRVRAILLASAAIPAVFPPVLIDGAAYADGGVTANVFLRLDPEAADGLVQVWKRRHPELPLPRFRYWIIINNQLQQPPKTVQLKWPHVMAPSLGTAIRSATLAEVRWLTAQAHYANAAYGTDIEVRVVAIPDDWRPPVPGDFQKQTMESLTDLGRKLGADPASWSLWASPKKRPGGN